MRIYFMGICGTAMGNAARLLKAQGHSVCGADAGIYPPMSTVLADAGIEIFEGFDADRLARLEPDHVVVGNAMSRGNEEVEWLLNQASISYGSLPQLIHDRLLRDRCPVVIAGTHGKTTTSTITAFLLEHAGMEPGWLIGGVPRDLPAGAQLGTGKAFVIEGDEYDSAFFDKRGKFIHYRPQIAVLGNLEFDHADIFRDLQDVQRSFQHFLRIIPSSGAALVNGDDDHLTALLPAPWTKVIRVGIGPNNDLILSDFTDGPQGASFELVWKGERWARIDWRLHGLFNARNAAMAALAAALASGCAQPTDFSLEALANFNGVQRRQDILYASNDWVVVEDFAHHPTAVAGALEALRSAYPERYIHACFEPRSNTAVKALFQDQFTEALRQADAVSFAPVHRAERLDPEGRLDTMRMAAELNAAGRTANAYSCHKTLLDGIKGIVAANAGGLVVFFSNGSFDGIQHKTVALLRESRTEPHSLSN